VLCEDHSDSKSTEEKRNEEKEKIPEHRPRLRWLPHNEKWDEINLLSERKAQDDRNHESNAAPRESRIEATKQPIT